MSASKTSGIVENIGGQKVIPASIRPDGTVRKERKVRDGWTAVEDIPLYKNPFNRSTSRFPEGVPIGATLSQQDPLADRRKKKKPPKVPESNEPFTTNAVCFSHSVDSQCNNDQNDILRKKKMSLEKKLRQIEKLKQLPKLTIEVADKIKREAEIKHELVVLVDQIKLT